MALAALVAIFLRAQKSLISGPSPYIMALVTDISRLKIITYRAIKTTGTLIVIPWYKPSVLTTNPLETEHKSPWILG